MKQLKLYFTSDLHGYLYPTDYLNQQEKNMGLLNCMNHFKKDGNTLIIDGGDTIQGSPFTTYLSNKTPDIHPMATVMNAAGYDYVTLGNHEFNYGYDYLKSYINHLQGKCLSANITDKTKEINLIPSDIKVMENGLKVGIIGFSTDFINRWERDINIENFEISDVYNSILTPYNTLKGQVDLLIGLYHGGFEYDLETNHKLSETKENIAYKICKEFEFDLLLTGHQHMPLSGQSVHGTYIVQTPHNGTSFIELNIEVDTFTGSKTFSSQLQPASLPAQPEMYEQFLTIEQSVQQWLDTPVGHLSQQLEPSSHLEMAIQGSPLANFINQIQLHVSNADIACTSFANSIKGFEKNVTVRDILSTYVYPNTLVVLSITGEILKKALERCASYFTIQDENLCISDSFLKPKVEHYNYDYYSNIDYTFDLTKPVGKRVSKLIYQDNDVNDNDTFTLVMNNYRASGAGGYDFFADCATQKEILTEMPEIIINYFKEYPMVTVDESTYIHIVK